MRENSEVDAHVPDGDLDRHIYETLSDRHQRSRPTGRLRWRVSNKK